MDAVGAADESADLRTAKSCGPDAPTLVSSSQNYFPQCRMQKSPVTAHSPQQTVTAIRARAAKGKGGATALAKLWPPAPNAKSLAKLGDDRVLAEMTKRVFSAGFAWSVIEAKWHGFEEAFLGFQAAKLAFKPDEFWEALTSDTRIVRNGAKIMSVRDNARFVQEIAREHGSFGKFLSKRPSPHEITLFDLLSKHGSRLGGNTGQMLLRFLGWDVFVTSKDRVACLRDAGLDGAHECKSEQAIS